MIFFIDVRQNISVLRVFVVNGYLYRKLNKIYLSKKLSSVLKFSEI